MSCKCYRHRIVNVPPLGQPEPIRIQEDLCLLKFQSNIQFFCITLL